jgi:TetR/AcrR family transcriptional repressor of mexJK operon
MSEKIGKRELAKREKREKILAQAIELFSKYGYEATTIQMIADGVGISFGSVFSYFKTKDSLYEAAVLEPLDQLKAQLLTIDYETKDPLSEIKRFAEDNILLYSKNRVYLRLIQQAVSGVDAQPAIVEQLDRFYFEFQVGYLIPLIEKGQKYGQLYDGDPKVIAISYFSFLNGIRLTIGNDEGHEIWKHLIPQAVRLFGPKEGMS